MATDAVVRMASVIEALYILYMYNFFRTTYSVHHPLEAVLTRNTALLRHPIATGFYESKICPLGNIVGVLVATFLTLRARYYVSHAASFGFATRVVFSALAVGTLLTNMNAFVYLAPLLLVEWQLGLLRAPP